MQRILGFGLVLALLASPVTAFAQDTVQGEDKTVFKKKTTIDFSDVTLEGELTKPEGAYGLVRTKTRFKSLINPRTTFNPELKKSAEAL